MQQQIHAGGSVYARPVAKASVSDRLDFLKRVYAWMAGALILCAVGTMASIQFGLATKLLGLGFIGNMVVWGAWVAMAAVVQKVQFTPVTNVVAFSAYALFTGVIVSSIVLVALIMGEQIAGNAMLYVAQAFGITAGVFGGLSIYAYTTKTDFSWMRGVLFVGVIALIILSIVNFFVQSSIFTMAVSFLGVLIFSGYTLYDTQKIMREYPANAHIAAAMALFTNFIMLFMYILRLILMLAGGGNRD